MNNNYKSALDKIHLNEKSKKEMKQLFKKNNMNKKVRFIKPVAAIAACMVLVVGISNFGNVNSQKSENGFVIMVNAEELKSGKTVINENLGFAGVVCENEGEGVSYNIEFPITCKGENISKVTYSVKNAVFQISNPEGESIVTDGIKPDKKIETPASTVSDEGDVINQYTSFTVDYNKQASDKTTIDLAYDSALLSDVNHEVIDKIFNGNIYDDLNAHKELYKNILISCTITYNDGTTEKKNIKVGATIEKYSNVFAEDQGVKKDNKGVFTTYTVE